MSEQLTIPGTPPAGPRPELCTKGAYKARCADRWYGLALNNALANWDHWEGMKPTLVEALTAFHRDPQLEDAAGMRHNPDGTLTAMLWKLQTALQPDNSRLGPLLDFEEHWQKIFLSRGLIIYCDLLLREMDAPQPTP